MRNEKGQLGKYVRSALGGAVFGLAGGAVYAAAWGVTHWTVSGRGLSSATAPWLLVVGTVIGLLAGLAWAAGLKQPQGAPEAGYQRRAMAVPGGINRLRDTAVLRRLRG